MIYFKTKKKAVERATEVRKQLHSKGWKIETWRNCGYWYYSLINGPLQLYEGAGNSHVPYFWTLLSDMPERSIGGACHWTEKQTYKDPNRAVKRQLELAESYLDRISFVVGYVRKIQGE